jgi:hypothetical protein
MLDRDDIFPHGHPLSRRLLSQSCSPQDGRRISSAEIGEIIPFHTIPKHRRAVAVLAFVAALLVIGTFVLWLFQLTASTSISSLGHFISTGTFYAAESGMEMGLRELNQQPATDIDSDGLVGTISNDGNLANDPALASGAFCVERVSTTPPTYRATGRPTIATAPWSSFRRIVEVQAQ